MDPYDRSKAGVSTWVFTIARNKRIDALRRERRPELDPDDPMLVHDGEPSAERVVEAAQDERRLKSAMQDLPEEQATLIRLSYYEDMPHSQIADHLGLPLGTVKSRARLALGKLRRHLGN